MKHPLHQFRYCPQCGQPAFSETNEKAKQCSQCGFVYYFNPAAAVACFVRNPAGELLWVRRAKDPARGTLDLAGGFVDCYESAEDAVAREIKEETGLEILACRYLFSFPNIYPYAGFDVHTVDLFFECLVADFTGAAASDDAAEITIALPRDINPADFGLASIRKGVCRYFKDFLKMDHPA